MPCLPGLKEAEDADGASVTYMLSPCLFDGPSRNIREESDRSLFTGEKTDAKPADPIAIPLETLGKHQA